METKLTKEVNEEPVLVFTEVLIETYNYIRDLYEDTKMPKFIKNLIVKYMVNKTIKIYDKEITNISLNYPIMKDFARFYLNSIERVNAAFNYSGLLKGFKQVNASANFVKLYFKKSKNKYNIVFRDNEEVEVTHTDNDDPTGDSTSIVYIDYRTINDNTIERYLKQEMITYIKYFIKTYCF